MADKETTQGVDASGSPATADTERARRTSPPKDEEITGSAAAGAEPETGDDLAPEEEVTVEADDDDSAIASDRSDTTSIASSIYAGYVENGRRYQTLREGEYWGPSDDKQFASMDGLHLTYLILESQSKNPYFRSSIPKTAQNILDIGTGSGIWAKDVADLWPSAVVQGVDLYPPPETWVPPNCRFIVDDVLKPWDYQQQFDLIHLRMLTGSFTDEQWRLLYKQIHTNLLPGGYIEQLEASVTLYCDDGTLPAASYMAKWGPMFLTAAAKTGRPLDTADTMKARIEAAGFVNMREKAYKVPVGEWAKNPVLKEAGKYNKSHFEDGMEGYAMFLLTKFGEPEPWSPEEVQVFLAKIRQEMKAGYHTYFLVRRVWAQKPHVEAEE